MKEKSELQEKLKELKPWLPDELAVVLGRHFKVSAQTVRYVWAGERNHASIMEATNLIVSDAEKAKAESFKQLAASLS